MIIFGVFSNYYDSDCGTDAEDFVDVFSTEEKAQAYIDERIHQTKLRCKREQLGSDFSLAWQEKNPRPAYENIRETKPRFDQSMTGNREYQKAHEQRIHEWRAAVERPAQEEYARYMTAFAMAVDEYMKTIDMDKQDLSDVDLAYYGRENTLIIKPLEVK
jgi:hypothetical protein